MSRVVRHFSDLTLIRMGARALVKWHGHSSQHAIDRGVSRDMPCLERAIPPSHVPQVSNLYFASDYVMRLAFRFANVLHVCSAPASSVLGGKLGEIGKDLKEDSFHHHRRVWRFITFERCGTHYLWSKKNGANRARSQYMYSLRPRKTLRWISFESFA